MTVLMAMLVLLITPVPGAYAATSRTIEVDAIDDSNPEGGCTLREAIDVANAGLGPGLASNGCTVTESGGGIPITYEINLPSYTYTLTGSAGDDGNTSGDLDVLANVSINGSGAGSTAIDGGSIDRVFHVPISGLGVTLSISSVTVQNGSVTGDGGGILNNGNTLIIASSTIAHNVASGYHGGIGNTAGTLNVSQSTIASNTALDSGGGIGNRAGTLIVSHSTITHNAVNRWRGGGISSSGSSIIGTDIMTITNSVVTNNTASDAWSLGGGINIATDVGAVSIRNTTIARNAAGSGGGINYERYGLTGGPDPVLNISNSTISHNSASRDGGGILVNNDKGTTNLANATVADNIADDDNDGTGDGGGIYHGSGTFNTKNTIVAGNDDRSGGGSDCFGTFASQQYNLIGINSGCVASFPAGQPNGNNDLVGTGGLPLNPLLSGLMGYHALLPDSPAIDAGNPAGCTDHLGSPLTTDQRGWPRPLDGDGDGDAICDIGSYEFDPEHPIRQVFLPCIGRNYCSGPSFDDFSNPASGWDIVDDSYVRTEYLSGEYRVLTKQSGYFYLFRAPTCNRQNYTVEVDARWVGTPGSSYGLIFGLTSDYSQYYLFDMNTDYQQFRLLRRDLGGFVTVVPITYAAAINGGTALNHLKVTRNGTEITLEVNGTVLGTWYDGTIGGFTGAGLVTNPYPDIPVSDARFDNFSMAGLPGSRAVAREPSGVIAEEGELATPDARRDLVPADLGW